jgi:phytoene dehydrogenase-like protein
MFLAGNAVLPEDGAGALPRNLARSLPTESIHPNRRVDGLHLDDGAVAGVRVDGEILEASAVVVATNPLTASKLTGIETIPTSKVGCVTVYLASNHPPPIGTYLALDGTGTEPVNHIAPLSQVQPSYAPNGEHLIAAVMLGEEAVSRDDDTNGRLAQQSAAKMLYDSSWRLIDVVNLQYCFYDQQPALMRRLPDATTGVTGLFLASDATVDASINGAMMSGEDAAWTVRMAIGDGS